jgi:peptide/nickel transport system ATP-binding protein
MSTNATTVLSARELVVEYNSPGHAPTKAVKGVDLDLFEGETLGIVGESGCGKTSMGRALIQLPPPTSGDVRLGDEVLTGRSSRSLRQIRRQIQFVFQDPISSLNPRRTALQIVTDSLLLHKIPEPRRRAMEMLERVGVDEAMAMRRPHQLSGGQCQRVSIARSLVLNPRVLICDEPVSALDVSVQAAVLNLLEEMKAEYQLSMVFISHDLAVVKGISDRVAVMYLGSVVEIGPAEALYARPLHHYTELLLSSVPDPRAARRRGRTPSEVARTTTEGCAFASRCPAATEVCLAAPPPLVELEPNRSVACHHPAS